MQGKTPSNRRKFWNWERQVVNILPKRAWQNTVDSLSLTEILQEKRDGLINSYTFAGKHGSHTVVLCSDCVKLQDETQQRNLITTFSNAVSRVALWQFVTAESLHGALWGLLSSSLEREFPVSLLKVKWTSQAQRTLHWCLCYLQLSSLPIYVKSPFVPVTFSGPSRQSRNVNIQLHLYCKDWVWKLKGVPWKRPVWITWTIHVAVSIVILALTVTGGFLLPTVGSGTSCVSMKVESFKKSLPEPSPLQSIYTTRCYISPWPEDHLWLSNIPRTTVWNFNDGKNIKKKKIQTHPSKVQEVKAFGLTGAIVGQVHDTILSLAFVFKANDMVW